MSTLLIKNIHQLVTCDDEDRVLHNADLYCEDGFIKAIGTALDISADEVIDGSHMLCYPGLVWSTPTTTCTRCSPGTYRRCRTWSCSTG